jgi:ABC-2 type transport system ATP-binding protein
MSAHSGSSALSVRDLRKTYGNGVEALKGVSLDVAEGDFFALLGPNGAGKSTLIGIVSSLVNASSGAAQRVRRRPRTRGARMRCACSAWCRRN